jgi:hypothetical protein
VESAHFAYIQYREDIEQPATSLVALQRVVEKIYKQHEQSYMKKVKQTSTKPSKVLKYHMEGAMRDTDRQQWKNWLCRHRSTKSDNQIIKDYKEDVLAVMKRSSAIVEQQEGFVQSDADELTDAAQHQQRSGKFEHLEEPQPVNSHETANTTVESENEKQFVVVTSRKTKYLLCNSQAARVSWLETIISPKRSSNILLSIKNQWRCGDQCLQNSSIVISNVIMAFLIPRYRVGIGTSDHSVPY